MPLKEQNQRLRNFFADMVKGLGLVWTYGKKPTIINCGLFLAQAGLPLLSLHIFRSVIDEVVHDHADWHQYGSGLLLFAGVQLLNFLAAQMSDYFISVQQQLTSDLIAQQVLNKAVQLPLKYYEMPSFYDQLHMVQQQSLSRPAQLIAATLAIIQNLVMVIAFSAYMVGVHWSVLLLVLLLGIPLTISKLIHGYQQYRLDKDVLPKQRQAADLYSYLTTYPYAKEVRIFGFGRDFISRFFHLKQFVFNKRKELYYRFLKQNLLIQLFEIIVITAIYAIIISQTVTGLITVGGLVVYFQAFQRLQGSLTGLLQGGVNLFQHQLYLREMLTYLSVPVATTSADKKMPPLSQGISIRSLDFTYPETQRQVLHHVFMEFKPGKITAIVGENGSGKSTLMKLLCGLYDADKNSILIDGTDIALIEAGELQRNTTAVFQDFGKYYLTIEDNITLGSERQSKEKLELAAQRAGIADKISTFSEGYNTNLGRTFRNGEQLSGGQWQKTALARSFYRDSNLVLMDEPTSSLDPVAEYNIFQQLKAGVENKVVVLITHRLYNLKIADHIYVMENGAVTESGTFTELLSNNGAFARMYERQSI